MSLTADGRPAGSRPGWFLAVGFAGLAIALASIADMFSARPYDGIVPVPYGREGIDVRLVLPGTPAEKAGLRPATGTKVVDGQEQPTGGDIVVEFDGDAVTSAVALQSAVDARSPGDTVSITVVRDNSRRTFDVTLGVRP